MQELKIILTDEDEIALLDEIALQNKKSSLDYVTEMVRSFLQSQLKGRYLKEIQKLDVQGIKTLTGTAYKGIIKKAKGKEV
jgi:hypothetical protein